MRLERAPYATATYASALAAGPGSRPVDVPEWSTFVIARSIDGGGEDVTGPYPRTPIAPAADIEAGLERLAREGLVSVMVVPDPLASPTPERLGGVFAVCRPFKTHQIIDREKGPYAPSKHHRTYIKRALRHCVVERVALADVLGDWKALYAGLVDQHAITGPAVFSAAYFASLADDPTFVAFAAKEDGRLVSMGIWFEHDGVAYSHLGASSADGYAVGASYAVNDAAISHFDGASVIDLGGGAGVSDEPSDGLAWFKHGFANSQVTAMVCGAVLDPSGYNRRAAGKSRSFFPAYRG